MRTFLHASGLDDVLGCRGEGQLDMSREASSLGRGALVAGSSLGCNAGPASLMGHSVGGFHGLL